MDEFDKAAWEDFANSPFVPGKDWRAIAAERRAAANPNVVDFEERRQAALGERFLNELREIIAAHPEVSPQEVSDIINEVLHKLGMQEAFSR
jgi:hypothetical protein